MLIVKPSFGGRVVDSAREEGLNLSPDSHPLSLVAVGPRAILPLPSESALTGLPAIQYNDNESDLLIRTGISDSASLRWQSSLSAEGSEHDEEGYSAVVNTESSILVYESFSGPWSEVAESSPPSRHLPSADRSSDSRSIKNDININTTPFEYAQIRPRPVSDTQFVIAGRTVPLVERGNEKRTRMRRPNFAPRKGPNRYGRKGCRRCSLCRKWRQKCVYESIQSRCKLCQERNLPCDEKVLGPRTEPRPDTVLDGERPGQLALVITRPPSIPDDQQCTPLDLQYLQFFYTSSHLCIFSLALTGLSQQIWSHDLRVPAALITFPIPSKPLRYATLAFTAFNRVGRSSDDLFRYIDQCYKHLNEAISESAFVDVAYTIHACVVLSLKLEESMETILVHFRGFCGALRELAELPSGLTIEDYGWLEGLWVSVLLRLNRRLRLRFRHDHFSLRILYAEIHALLQSCEYALIKSIISVQERGSHQKVDIFAICLHYSFYHYLSSTSMARGQQNRNGAHDASKSLKLLVRLGVKFGAQLIPQVVEQIQRFSEVPSKATPPPQLYVEPWQLDIALLYYTAMLIDHVLLSSISDRSNTLAKAAAIGIYHLYLANSQSQSRGYILEINALFLAALVLTPSLYPAENATVREHLHNVIEGLLHSAMCEQCSKHLQFLTYLETCLEKADGCVNLDMIRSFWEEMNVGHMMWECIVPICEPIVSLRQQKSRTQFQQNRNP